MSTCRIQFTDRSLSQFNWCKFDETGKADTGSAPVEDLRSVCSKAGAVSIFLAAQDTLLTKALLPPRAGKQQLNAIAFAIEDQLADDIDDDFFAVLPQQADHSVPVAVIEREIMDRVSEVLTEQHVQTRSISPSVYLCPKSADAEWLASICAQGEGYVLRFGDHAGCYCASDTVALNLMLLQQNAPAAKRVDLYLDSIPDALTGLDSLQFETKGHLALLSSTSDFSQGINLKQKEYQSSHAWLGLLKRWRAPMIALVLLALVFVGGSVANLWLMETQYAALISQQQDLLKSNVPSIEPGSRPKDQLVKLLGANSDGEENSGFLDLLHEYSRLKNGLANLTTSKMVYQQGRLIINVETKALQSLDSLREKLASSKVPAEVDNVSIKPDQTTARIILGTER